MQGAPPTASEHRSIMDGQPRPDSPPNAGSTIKSNTSNLNQDITLTLTPEYHARLRRRLTRIAHSLEKAYDEQDPDNIAKDVLAHAFDVVRLATNFSGTQGTADI